jgi:hypothetical protein
VACAEVASAQADPGVSTSTEVTAPLSMSAIMTDRRLPRLPPSVSRLQQAEVVTIKAEINAEGGVRAYQIVNSNVPEYEALARRSFLESKFSAPRLAKPWIDGLTFDTCVPWGQHVMLSYSFAGYDDGLAKLEQAFEEFARVSTTDVDRIRAWNATEGVTPSSKSKGFTDLKPNRRPPPRFPKSAFNKLYSAQVADPQVMHISFRVDPDGKVGSMLVLGDGEFAPNISTVARAAIRNWRFDPARIDGIAIPRIACQQMKFDMTLTRGSDVGSY